MAQAKRAKTMLSKSQVLACLTKCGVDVSDLKKKSVGQLMSIAREHNIQLRADPCALGLADLPDELLRIILASVATHVSAHDAKVLFHLGLSCKALHRLLSEDEDSEIWKNAWTAVRNSSRYYSTVAGAKGSARQKVKLLAFHGCQMCKDKPLTRKVYWCFGGRFCKECLYATTVSGKHIKKETAIPLNEVYSEGVPYQVAEMWNRWLGTYTRHFFWGPSLAPLLLKYHGVNSMAELRAKRDEEAAARAKAHADRQAERAAAREKAAQERQQKQAEREAQRAVKAAEKATKQKALEEKRAAAATKKAEKQAQKAARQGSKLQQKQASVRKTTSPKRKAPTPQARKVTKRQAALAAAQQMKELAAADAKADESDQEADQPAAAFLPDEAATEAATAVPETVQQADAA